MNLELDLESRLVPLHTGASGLRAQLPVTVAADDTDADLFHIRASDETLDRYQEIIVASGWRLDHYRRNPVIQNAHQYGDIIHTIGKAEQTWVSGNQLLQTWKFAAQENPLAKIARDLYRGRFLNAASVGFVPLRWENGTEKSGFRRRYIEQELLEVSAIGIPANPNALALAVKCGAIEKSDLRELAKLLNSLVRTLNSPLATPNSFRTHPAGPQADARAPGWETDGAQWLQLAREVTELAKRV